jgi:AraC-like DNA-binding protein
MSRQDIWNEVTYSVADNDAGFSMLNAKFKKHRSPRHAHAELVIATTSAGMGHFSSKSSPCVAQPGQILAFNPGQPHEGKTVPGHVWHYQAMHFDVRRLIGFAKTSLDLKGGLPSFEITSLDDAQLSNLFVKLFSTVSNGSTLQSDTLLVEFLAQLFKRHAGAALPCETVRPEPTRLRKVIDYLHENFLSEVRLRDLTQIARCPDHYLVRLFRRQYDFTPHAYLVHLRLNEARRLIELNEHSCVEIAAITGFCDQGHLIRQFKRAYAITPMSYRIAMEAGRGPASQ